jgi:hypothetical protein
MSMVIDKFANKEYLNASSTCYKWTGPSHLCSVRVLTCSCIVVAEAVENVENVRFCQSSLVSYS